MSQPPQFPQLTLIERAVEILKTIPHVRAAFTRSAFHSGQPDASADLELYIVAEDAPGDQLIALGRRVLDAAGPVVWVSVFETMPPRMRALIAGPLRLDLTIVTPTTLPSYAGWRILLDRDNLLRDLARQAPITVTLAPEHVERLCDQFWWNIFNSINQLKRNHLWLALHLLDTCRSDLAQMLRWRRDHERPFERFADLERHLTAEDQQALAQTLASYDLRAITMALLCAADAFDPAARDVAARAGAQYPATLAQFTKEHFIRELWALVASNPTMSA